MIDLNAKYYSIKYNGAPELQSGHLLNLNGIFNSYSTIKDAVYEIKERCRIYEAKKEDYTILEVNVNVKELEQ